MPVEECLPQGAAVSLEGRLAMGVPMQEKNMTHTVDPPAPLLMARRWSRRGFYPSDDGPKDSRRLVVVLTGWGKAPTKMNDIVQAVRETYPAETGLDLYVPPLDYAKYLSSTPAATIVNQLLASMDAICGDPARYSHIVLIGFSMGAVVARRLFLAATDVHKTVPNEPELSDAGLRHWAGRVERIVTLGGLSRGWLASGRLGWAESIGAAVVGLTGHLWFGVHKPTIFDVRRGAPFIVQTRLQWLALRRSSDPAKPEPLVIQLLGTQDEWVAPDDAIDFAVDRDSQTFRSRGRSKSPYYYFELPHTRHDDAIVFSPSKFDRNGRFGAARKDRLIYVLKSNSDTLAKKQIHAEYLVDTLPDEPDRNVKHVAFVIHGIRDDGYWTRKIAQKIQEKAASSSDADPAKWRCVTSSYGYFAMLPFVLPWIRRQKVEWLMDEYVGARARYPNAKFSYIGHSNGTYLVARALKDYPAACFRNVLFAGSVVRRSYEWAELLSAKRVCEVLNLVATRDWVVALFPIGLEPFRRVFDLGGAGFAGFDQARPEAKVPHLSEVRYVIGSHSGGVAETQWSRIADFIVDGKVPPPDDPDYSKKQSCFWIGVSKISTILLGLGLLLAVVAIPSCILYLIIFITGPTTTKVAVGTLLVVLYVIGLCFIITRV
jgi:pimeloyl-ACP methyl ester carboxylesterase